LPRLIKISQHINNISGDRDEKLITREKMKKENLLKKGNESIAIGTLWGFGSVIHPCPLCVLTTAAFIANGIKEKISDK
jgi:hypothetical protein